MLDKISKLNEEHEFVRDLGGLIMGVDKVGGGTLGREYTGDWEVCLYGPDAHLIEKIPVTTGMPHTHHYVAAMVGFDILEG